LLSKVAAPGNRNPSRPKLTQGKFRDRRGTPRIKALRVPKVSPEIEAKRRLPERWGFGPHRPTTLSQNQATIRSSRLDSSGCANPLGWVVAGFLSPQLQEKVLAIAGE
jgi:hypothetical protein